MLTAQLVLHYNAQLLPCQHLGLELFGCMMLRKASRKVVQTFIGVYIGPMVISIRNSHGKDEKVADIQKTEMLLAS